MRTRVFAIAALVGASALTINAQTPQPQDPNRPQQQRPTTKPSDPTTQQPTTPPRTATSGEQTVTVVGCLKAEKDVPGRKPNMAERAGMGEDFILTSVKMAPGSPTSAIGLASMYEIEGISDSELQKHLNHQVELTGRVDTSKGGATTGTRSGTGTTGTGTTGATGTTGTTASADLPAFHATSIKMVSATCPTP